MDLDEPINSGRKKTILVVDDEKMVRGVTLSFLHNLGYNTIPAGDGEEAVRIYQERKEEIDGVVLDMMMPGMDGVETYCEMRKINPGVKAMISSGYSEESQLNRAEEKGIEVFLEKPYNLNQLKEKLSNMLD